MSIDASTKQNLISTSRQLFPNEQSERFVTELFDVIFSYQKYGLSPKEPIRIGEKISLEQLSYTMAEVSLSMLQEGKYEAFIENLRSLLPYIYQKDSIKVENWYTFVMTNATKLYAHCASHRDFITGWYAIRNHCSIVVSQVMHEEHICNRVVDNRGKKKSIYLDYPREDLEEAIIKQIEKANKALLASLKPTRSYTKHGKSFEQNGSVRVPVESLEDVVPLEYRRQEFLNNTNTPNSTHLTHMVNKHALRFDSSKARKESHQEIKKLIARKLELQKAGEITNQEYKNICAQLLKALLSLIKKEVAVFMKRHEVNHLDFDDLFNEGCMGALTGIERHDGSTTLSTYCTWWIRHALGRAYEDKERTIRLPVGRHGQIRKLLKVDTALQEEGKSIYTMPTEELMAFIQEKYPSIAEGVTGIQNVLKAMTLRTVSDEVHIQNDGKTHTFYLSDTVAFDRYESGEESFINRIDTEKLIEIAKKVSDSTNVELLVKHIVYEQSLRELAEEHGLTKEAVRQRIEKVKLRVRQYAEYGCVIDRRRMEHKYIGLED